MWGMAVDTSDLSRGGRYLKFDLTCTCTTTRKYRKSEKVGTTKIYVYCLSHNILYTSFRSPGVKLCMLYVNFFSILGPFGTS